MLRALGQQSRTIRLPSHVVTLLAEARRTESTLVTELGRQPTGDEIARRLDIHPSQLGAVRQIARQPAPLDIPARLGQEDDLRTLGESVVDPAAEQAGATAAESADLSNRLHGLVAELAPREREVLRLRFGLDGRLRANAGAGGHRPLARRHPRLGCCPAAACRLGLVVYLPLLEATAVRSGTCAMRGMTNSPVARRIAGSSNVSCSSNAAASPSSSRRCVWSNRFASLAASSNNRWTSASI